MTAGSSSNAVFGLIEFPGREVFLERELEPGEDSHEGALRVALDAFFGVLRGYCRPLSFEILFSYWNDEFDFPVSVPEIRPPAKMLAVDSALPGLVRYPSYAEEVTYIEGDLSRAAVDGFVESVDYERIDGLSLGWQTMECKSCMAIVPVVEPSGPELCVERHGADISFGAVSVGDELWSYGPQDNFLNPPVAVHITHNDGKLTLNLAQFWSVWIDDGEGVPLIQEAISGLERSGWNRLR